jgi:protoheme IX farnesyltransferase
MVLITVAAGAFLAAPDRFAPLLLVETLLGAGLLASAASAWNQAIEAREDARMARTANRPLAAGRLDRGRVVAAAAITSVCAVTLLALRANLLAAAIGALTLLSYLFVYTPLKQRTSLATLIGAVPGALPPVIGWTAAGGGLTLPALVLFGIVFLWQMPHFLAIAWLHREDYARAGIPLLPVVEPDGRSTGRQALLYAALLLPVSLLPAAVGLAGVVYLVAAVVLGAGFVGMSARFAGDLSATSARRLFIASITYLPCLWAALVASRVWLQ